MGLNVHQKAAAYDKALVAIIALQKANPSDEGIQNWVNENFPELKECKESEDERIRKYLITYFTNIDDCASSIKGKDVITWLEKQGDVNALIQEASEKSYTEGMRTERKRWLEKQGEHLEDYDDEDILQRFSFYSYKDEPNIIYLSGLYVNAKHRNKGIGTKILTIADEVATSMGCNVIRLQTEIGSNAERLYRRNGYDTFKSEGNQVWLEKQAEQTPIIEMKSPEKSLGISSKEYNEIVNDCIYGESKPADNIESKFEVGKWIIDKESKEVFYIRKNLANTYEIVDIEGNDYYVPHYTLEEDYDVWTIQDAKEGDVLASKDGGDILVFRNLYTNISFSSYYNITRKGELGWSNSRFIPATKAQRDLLFQKLKEEGYEWDAEKKELKKIPIC